MPRDSVARAAHLPHVDPRAIAVLQATEVLGGSVAGYEGLLSLYGVVYEGGAMGRPRQANPLYDDLFWHLLLQLGENGLARVEFGEVQLLTPGGRYWRHRPARQVDLLKIKMVNCSLSRGVCQRSRRIWRFLIATRLLPENARCKPPDGRRTYYIFRVAGELA